MDKFEAKLKEIEKEIRGVGFRYVKCDEWGLRCAVTKRRLTEVLQYMGWGRPDNLDDFVKISFHYGEAHMHLKNGNHKKYWIDVMNYLREWIIWKEEEISDAFHEMAAKNDDIFFVDKNNNGDYVKVFNEAVPY